MPSQPIGFVSFAGGHLKWRFARIRIYRQIKKSQYFRSIDIYSEKKLHGLVDPLIAKFIQENHLGYGLWIWKPIIILDFLGKNPMCESILYLDAGCDFNPSEMSKPKWDEYISYLGDFNAIVFQTNHLEESYTSKQLIEKLHAESIDVNTGQIQAGTFFMTRKFAEEFCEEWLELMIDDDFMLLKNIKDNRNFKPYGSFIDYRYDQSVFSIMMKKRPDVKFLKAYLETEFAPDWKSGSSYPILSSRNRSIVPILKNRLIHRGIRRIERRVIRTYNSLKAVKKRNKQ